MCFNFSIMRSSSDDVKRSGPWSFDPIKNKKVKAPKHITLWRFSLDLIFSLLSPLGSA